METLWYLDNTDFKSKVTHMSLVYKTLTKPLTIAILKLLRDRRELCVTDIYLALKIEQSRCSMELMKMRKHDLVTRTRRGKKIYYSPNTNYINRLVADFI